MLHRQTVTASTNARFLGLPLNMATGLGFADTAQWLLEAGAEIADKPWNTICAALCIATRKRYTPVQESILDHATEREVAKFIFDVAAQQQRWEIVKMVFTRYGVRYYRNTRMFVLCCAAGRNDELVLWFINHGVPANSLYYSRLFPVREAAGGHHCTCR